MRTSKACHKLVISSSQLRVTNMGCDDQASARKGTLTNGYISPQHSLGEAMRAGRLSFRIGFDARRELLRRHKCAEIVYLEIGG
jgi:hypothetical protein